MQKPPYRLFLPVILREAGPPATPPVLNPIDNPSGDYDFTVSWNAAYLATGYVLEEDDNPGFSSPTQVYQGSSTSRNITGKDLGTYYYRVKATNSFGESGWSNVQSTTVTVAKPPCPQLGAWSGTNNQGRAISFNVDHSPSCRVSGLKITYRVTCSMGGYFTATTTFMSTQGIVNQQFDTGGSTPQVTGSFSSPTQASGTWRYSGINPYDPFSTCNSSGTWSATP